MSNEAYQRIWKTVLVIPRGKVASYSQVADLAGLPGRARLVGKALGKAPGALNVPWYRVLRADGKIAFPKGSDTAIQQIGLLQEEGVAIFKHKVKLSEFQWQPDLNQLLFELNY